MSKTKAIQVRIDSDLKTEIEKIFRELGISTSQAIGLFLQQVKLNRGIPFDLKLPHIPNKATRETLEKSRRGEELTRYDSLDEMFDSWDKL